MRADSSTSNDISLHVSPKLRVERSLGGADRLETERGRFRKTAGVSTFPVTPVTRRWTEGTPRCLLVFHMNLMTFPLGRETLTGA